MYPSKDPCFSLQNNRVLELYWNKQFIEMMDYILIYFCVVQNAKFCMSLVNLLYKSRCLPIYPSVTTFRSGTRPNLLSISFLLSFSSASALPNSSEAASKRWSISSFV